MKFLSFKQGSQQGLAVADGAGFKGLLVSDANYPGLLSELIVQGPDALKRAGQALLKGAAIDMASVACLPPLDNPGKIICIGLNYVDHSLESGFAVPTYPAIFSRFPSSMWVTARQ